MTHHDQRTRTTRRPSSTTRHLMSSTIKRAGALAGIALVVAFLLNCRSAENAALAAATVLGCAWCLFDAP